MEKRPYRDISPGGTIVVTASMGPKIIAEVEPALARKGVKILDAPVMADFNDAEAGRMHVIVSGEPSLIEGKKELLNDMSSELYIVGDKPEWRRPENVPSGSFLLDF